MVAPFTLHKLALPRAFRDDTPPPPPVDFAAGPAIEAPTRAIVLSSIAEGAAGPAGRAVGKRP
jgi:hypothetical protein